jgi:ABC-type branched-subunit amino acid transport system ATPase component/branched-subunit amino acid ABC-type transport system permease component
MELLRFAILGLGLGGLYALAAQGVVLVYRGSGVLNFASGAIGMIGAYACFELRDAHGLAPGLALLAGVAASAAISLVVYLVVMRPLRRSSALAQVIATLGLLLFLRELVVQHYQEQVRVVASLLPAGTVDFGSQLTIGRDRVLLFAAACAITLLLWAVYRWTRFGLATTAVVQSERSLAALGWSPNLVAAVNWALGGALAGLAACLLAPITGLSSNLALLVIPALAAALIGSFRSFPLTLLGAIAIGVAESLTARYVSDPAWSRAVPFIAITLILIARGSALPVRGELAARLPALGSGRIDPRVAAAGASVAVALIAFVLSEDAVDAVTTSLLFATVVLSVVVVTGYAGQISLAQYTIAGVGAWIAARLAATQGWPFELALLAGVAGVVPVGLLLALPALRTRGVNLAVVTLGLGLVIEQLVLDNPNRTGGLAGTVVDGVTLFGLDVNAIDHPRRYALLCLAAFLLAACAVANLRRGRAGRRLIAVRGNERAAAALGVSVVGAKLYAFALGSAVAALGGVLLAFRNPRVQFDRFSLLDSIYAVALGVIGGIGFVAGAAIGAVAATGGVLTQVLSSAGEVDSWIRLFGGLGVVVTLLQAPDGVAGLGRRLRRGRGRAESWALPAETSAPERVVPRRLRAEGVVVRFGGVVAVDGAALSVDPGEVVGLIGPNGAGKSTLIDALTGIVKPAGGSVSLDGEPIDRLGAQRRARAGIGRSFQALELFEDVTVAENLVTAGDRRDARAYLSDLVRPGRARLSPAAVAAVREFELEDDLARMPGELSAGRRRLVAIARAISAQPSVLFLDEPAAGLDAQETAELGRLIRRLASERGIGVVLVEHDVPLVFGICDRVVVLDEGRVIASGTAAEVRDDPAVVAAYLGAPAPAAADGEEVRA